LTLDVSQRTGLLVEREVEPGLPGLSPEEELVVFRVAQESLTNAARHAGARRAWVSLRRTPAGLLLEIRDDGHGFEPGEAAGTGLRGMRERALLVGAALEMESGTLP
jgi:two-component system sensor histidine kinase UhpB